MTSSTWQPRSSNAASVRTAYTAPLAPVIATAIDRWDDRASVDINCNSCRCQVEQTYVPVQIKGSLHLREIVRAHQRLFVHEQNGNSDDAGEIDSPEVSDWTKRSEAHDRDHMHRARDGQRMADTEVNRNRLQTIRAVEIEVLAGIEHIEAAHPRADCQGQQPGFDSAPSPSGQPSPDRSHCHCETKKEL